MKPQIQTGIILALIILGIVLGVMLLYNLAALVLLVLIAIVITNGIDPIVRRVQSIRINGHFIPRSWASIIVMLIALFALCGLFIALTITLVQESVNFATKTWPTAHGRLVEWVMILSRKYPTVVPQPGIIFKKISAQSGQLTGFIWSTTHAVFGFIGGLFSVLTVFILTLFFTIFKDGICYTFSQLIPPRYQRNVQDILHLAALRMGGWLRGQLTLAFIIGLLVIIGMFVLGMPYAILIGAVSGLGELIPMVGAYLGLIPALIIVLVATPFLWWKVIAVLVFFIALMQVENYYLGPRVMQEHAELPPVTTILALLTGGALLGIVGALLAIPLTAAGRVIMLKAIFPAIQGKSLAEIEDGRPGSVVPIPDHPPGSSSAETTEPLITDEDEQHE